MKKYTILCVLMMACYTIAAQGKKESSVLAAVEALRIAMINADSIALHRLTSARLTYGHSSGLVEQRSAFVNKIVAGTSDFVTIQLADQQVEVAGKTAIVRHTLHATTNDQGKPGEVHLKVLLVWHQYKGKWKLLARQAVKINS